MAAQQKALDAIIGTGRDGRITLTFTVPATLYHTRTRGKKAKDKRTVAARHLDVEKMAQGGQPILEYLFMYGVKQASGDGGAEGAKIPDAQVNEAYHNRVDTLERGVVPGSEGRGGGAKVPALFVEVQTILTANHIAGPIARTVVDEDSLSAFCKVHRVGGIKRTPKLLREMALKQIANRSF